MLKPDAFFFFFKPELTAFQTETLKARRDDPMYLLTCASVQVPCNCHGEPHKDGTAASLVQFCVTAKLLSEVHPVLFTLKSLSSKTYMCKCPKLLSFVFMPPGKGSTGATSLVLHPQLSTIRCAPFKSQRALALRRCNQSFPPNYITANIQGNGTDVQIKVLYLPFLVLSRK